LGAWGGSLTVAQLYSRWGVLDRDGSWRVEPAYVESDGSLSLLPGSTMPLGEGLRRLGVYANHRWSVVDPRGRRSQSREYEWLELLTYARSAASIEPARFAYMERGLWGIADEKQQPLTPAEFDERPVYWDGSGLMEVTKDGRFGCIDMYGHWVVPAQFSEIEVCDRHQVRAKQGGVWGIWQQGSEWQASGESRASERTGEGAGRTWVSLGAEAEWRPDGSGYTLFRHGAIQSGIPQVDEARSLFMHGQGRQQGEWLGIVRRGDLWGVLDARGKERLPLRFEGVGAIHDGLYAVKRRGKWGIVDGGGREIFAPTFERVMPFSRDVAISCEAALCGLVDRRGRVLLEPTYSSIEPLSAGIAVARMTEDGGRLVSSGLIDADGRVLVGQEYYSIEWFSDYLVRAIDAKDQQALLETETGKPVLGPAEIVGPVGVLSEGLADVELRTAGGKPSTGYIDSHGRLAIAPRFDQAGAFLDGVAVVKQADRCGVIDRRGKTVLPAEYQHCSRLPDGRVLFAEEAPLQMHAPPKAID
jgi:hypothetical protein